MSFEQENDNITNIKIQVREDFVMNPDTVVIIERQGNSYAEILHKQWNTKPGLVRLSKEEYLVKNTGEIFNYNRHEGKNIQNLRKTFAKLRGLIRTNFEGGATNQLLVTLEYHKNMQDDKQLYRDFKVFIKRIRREFIEYNFEYIVVMEPQGRGAWHAHMMIKSINKKYLFLDNKMIRKHWQEATCDDGNIDIQRLKSGDVGSYYVAYFTDVTVEGDNVTSQEMTKARKKGARLNYYPSNFKFYRTSRGIVRPEKEEILYSDVVEEFGNPVYEKTLEIIGDLGRGERPLNLIHRATFKKNL